MNKEKVIKGLRAIGKVQKTLTDEQALECADIYPEWNGDGKQYAVGDRVTYNEKLYKVLQAHTSQTGWTPTAAPSLFAEILAGQDGTDIGEWAQPDSTNPYKKGDRVTHNGKIWENIVEDTEDGKGRNTWEPGVYGWIEVA